MKYLHLCAISRTQEIKVPWTSSIEFFSAVDGIRLLIGTLLNPAEGLFYLYAVQQYLDGKPKIESRFHKFLPHVLYPIWCQTALVLGVH